MSEQITSLAAKRIENYGRIYNKYGTSEFWINNPSWRCTYAVKLARRAISYLAYYGFRRLDNVSYLLWHSCDNSEHNVMGELIGWYVGMALVFIICKAINS